MRIVGSGTLRGKPSAAYQHDSQPEVSGKVGTVHARLPRVRVALHPIEEQRRDAVHAALGAGLKALLCRLYRLPPIPRGQYRRHRGDESAQRAQSACPSEPRLLL